MTAAERDGLGTFNVLGDVAVERARQDALWGPERRLPNGSAPEAVIGGARAAGMRDYLRDRCDARHRAGHGTWLDIAAEEAFEAFAEDDPAKLRAELIQAAAVFVCWAEDVDRQLADGDRL